MVAIDLFIELWFIVFNLHIFLQVLVPEIIISMLSRWWYFIMEKGKYQEYTPEELSEVPPLIKHMSSIELDDFDSIEESDIPNNQRQSFSHSLSTLPSVSSYANHVYCSEGRISYGTYDICCF